MKFLLLILLAVTASAQVMIPPGALVSSKRPASAGSSTLLNDLVAYWKLDEESGTRNDSVGANHLTDNNTVASATGKVGNAGDFESANSEWLSISDNADVSTGDVSYTLCAWVKFESLVAIRDVFGKWGAAGSREFILNYNAGANRMEFFVSSNGTAVASAWATAPTVGAWHCIVVWHDADDNTINIQMDNGAVATTAHGGGSIDSGTALGIGLRGSGTTTYFDGLIDEVGFWKRVLTADERTELYNSGNGKTYPFN